MSTTRRWASTDLDELPDDEWIHYEIIDGSSLSPSTPHVYHQHVRGEISVALWNWNKSLLKQFSVFKPAENQWLKC